MARPLRIEYPGAWYHVMNRGGDGISSLTSSLTPTINVTTFLLYWVRCIPVTGRRFMPMVRWAITTTYSHVRGQSPAGYASCEWVVYPILLSHRGQRRDIISWALQGHPRRCRHPLARTISLYSIAIPWTPKSPVLSSYASAGATIRNIRRRLAEDTE